MHVFLTYKVYNQLRTDGKEFNLSEQFAGSFVWHWYSPTNAAPQFV